MTEIVVISGKGGTGKTSVTASLAMLAGKKTVVADCDVDASDLHLLLSPENHEIHDFYSGELAVINIERCTSCGICERKCNFDAIKQNDSKFEVNPLKCEGCGLCAEICPENAIDLVMQNVGKWYLSHAKTGGFMVHASLKAGAENSGKLVSKVKQAAAETAKQIKLDYVIVDGSPGIGCPVISSLSGADFVLLVTEPTVSGFHDLKRIHKLVEDFQIPCGCIINKYDLNFRSTQKILEYIKKNNISYINSLPYDENFTRAMTMGQTIIEYERNSNLSNLLSDSLDKIFQLTTRKKNEDSISC